MCVCFCYFCLPDSLTTCTDSAHKENTQKTLHESWCTVQEAHQQLHEIPLSQFNEPVFTHTHTRAHRNFIRLLYGSISHWPGLSGPVCPCTDLNGERDCCLPKMLPCPFSLSYKKGLSCQYVSRLFVNKDASWRSLFHTFYILRSVANNRQYADLRRT